MKTLYIVRGVSGSGKSTFAESICDHLYPKYKVELTTKDPNDSKIHYNKR